MSNRGFRPPVPSSQARALEFPSVGTFQDRNCVSIDNFWLYVTKIPDYEIFTELYTTTLESAIAKIKNTMNQHISSVYTEYEIRIINGIKGIITSELQTDEDGNIYTDRRTKTICPNLLRIISGGKNRRHTNKQKRRKYSHKYRKSKKTGKFNKLSR